MAKKTPALSYTNPEVRFERADIEVKAVVYFGLALTACTLLAVISMLWYAGVLLRQYRKPDLQGLPQSSVDNNRLPPQPRFEALDDVQFGKFRLYPDRATESYREQDEILQKGERARGVLPIDEAMKQVLATLPIRKKDNQAPTGFGIRLPSKASSAQTTTGEQ